MMKNFSAEIFFLSTYLDECYEHFSFSNYILPFFKTYNKNYAISNYIA